MWKSCLRCTVSDISELASEPALCFFLPKRRDHCSSGDPFHRWWINIYRCSSLLWNRSQITDKNVHMAIVSLMSWLETKKSMESLLCYQNNKRLFQTELLPINKPKKKNIYIYIEIELWSHTWLLPPVQQLANKSSCCCSVDWTSFHF